MVSVLVAVYNVKDDLKRCMKSIIGQTYTELEIIVVDDGSTDGSADICDEYKNKDSRVRVIHKENGGLSSARNVGIENATGDYVLMVDSDDYMLPNMIEIMLSTIKEHNADICICGAYENQPDNTVELHKVHVYDKAEAMKQILTDKISSQTWNKLIKRSCIGDVKFPIGMVAQDMSVMHLFFYQAETIISISDKLYVYITERPTSTTNINRKKVKSSLDRAIHSQHRYEFAIQYYPDCASEILRNMYGFYISAYLKQLACGAEHEIEFKIRETMKTFWNEAKQRKVLPLTKKIIAWSIINNCTVLNNVISYLYLRRV